MTYDQALKIAQGEKGWTLTAEHRAHIKCASKSDIASCAMSDMGEVSVYCRMMLQWF